MTDIHRRNVLGRAVAMIVATALGLRFGQARAADARQGTDHRVVIGDFAFAPEHLVLRPGDTITWINMDIAPHTATATDGSWDTGELVQGERKAIRVQSGMTETYYCRYHPHMKGSISAS